MKNAFWGSARDDHTTRQTEQSPSSRGLGGQQKHRSAATREGTHNVVHFALKRRHCQRSATHTISGAAFRGREKRPRGRGGSRSCLSAALTGGLGAPAADAQRLVPVRQEVEEGAEAHRQEAASDFHEPFVHTGTRGPASQQPDAARRMDTAQHSTASS